MTQIIDTHMPIEMAYANLKPGYFETLDPSAGVPRPHTLVDPRLCLPCSGPAFYSPWGDPTYLKPPGGIVMNGTPGATPNGGTGNYITPLPFLPTGPTGTVAPTSMKLPPSAAPNGGAMSNVLDEATDVWAEAQPQVQAAAAEAWRLGQKQIPLWWVVVGLGVLSILRR